jgi:hypothetical protein
LLCFSRYCLKGNLESLLFCHFFPSTKTNFSPAFFSVCGIKYKTRPGLKYHIKHTHKEGADMIPIQHHASVAPGAEDYLHEEGVSAHSSVGGVSLTPPSTPGGGATFLDLSGSVYAAESVMNSGAQTIKYQLALRYLVTILSYFCSARCFGVLAIKNGIAKDRKHLGFSTLWDLVTDKVKMLGLLKCSCRSFSFD